MEESKQESDSSSDSGPFETVDIEEESKEPVQERKARTSFISPYKELELPDLGRQVSDTEISKTGVNVFVRFRPDQTEEEATGRSCITYMPDGKEVSVDHENSSYRFRFRRMFPPETSQEQVFLSAALPLVENILNGYNSAILGYGQTGSGKTHTLLGPGYDNPNNVGKCDPELRGIAPRLLQSIFHQIYSTFSGEIVYRIYASYIHIYNEKIHDLLNPAKTKLTIYQDLEKGLWVTDATKVPMKSIDEVLKLLEMGTKLRVTAATNSNITSSRSHALLILTITKHISSEGVYRASQVYITDLCGSERISKTGAQEMRLIEAQNINKSLLALGNVIAALAEKRKHIPYRDSKVTRLLQNCFGGNSLTSLILCCSANSVNSHETLSTLRFGDRANLVQNKPTINQRESVDDLKRMLNQARAQILSQQRVIRHQNEKLIEKEIIMQDLYSMLGGQQLRSLEQRYQFKIQKKQLNKFDKLGINVFCYLFCYLHPFEVIQAFGINKMFNERLKSDPIWRFYLDKLLQGTILLSGINMHSWPDHKDVKGSYWETIRSILAAKYKRTLPHDPTGAETGLHLMPNLNKLA